MEEEAEEAGVMVSNVAFSIATCTAYVPDRDRDIEDTREAIRLKAEYKAAIKVKMEAEFTIHLMYWEPRWGGCASRVQSLSRS
jgi:hypothetical protein